MKCSAFFTGIVFIFSMGAYAQITTPVAPAEMPYQDEQFGCISSADADRYVHDFGIDVASFGGKELCNSAVDFKKLMNDLRLLEQGQFGAGENIFIRGFVQPTQYYSWMKSQTRGVERGNDVPYATAYNSGGYFTMQDGWAKLSTLGRVGTVVHEARHTAGYRHIVCNQGTYQGTSVSGCDSTYAYGGSHAVEMEYYARVSVQGQNFHPVYKKMARLMAIARSNIFFNTPVIQKKESLMALSEDRKTAYVLGDDHKWVSRETPAANGELKKTSFGAVIFDKVKAFAIDPYQNSGFSDLVTDTYSYFKLLLEKPLSIKDFEEFDQGTKRYVVKISTDNKIANYDFPNGDWGRELQLPIQVEKTSSYVVGQNQSGYYLIQKTGDVSVYQPETQRLVSLQNTKWDFSNKRVVQYNNQTLLLKETGLISKIVDQAEVPWEYAPADAKISDLVAVPIYNGFNVVTDVLE